MSRSPDYYRCCCGVHVHSCTFVLAIIGVVLSLLQLAGAISRQKNELYGNVVLGLISYTLLLIGNIKKKPILYIVYFILQTLTLISVAVVIVLAALALAGVNVSGHPEANPFLITLLVFLVIYFLLVLYTVFIVFRDYKFVKN